MRSHFHLILGCHKLLNTNIGKVGAIIDFGPHEIGVHTFELPETGQGRANLLPRRAVPQALTREKMWDRKFKQRTSSNS